MIKFRAITLAKPGSSRPSQSTIQEWNAFSKAGSFYLFVVRNRIGSYPVFLIGRSDIDLREISPESESAVLPQLWFVGMTKVSGGGGIMATNHETYRGH
jgi:hypothetical protein